MTDDDIIEEDEIIELPPQRPLRPCSPHLRDYQCQAYQKVHDGWADSMRQLVIMATGTGKTVLMGEIARDEVEAGGRVLLLAHTDELLDQAIEKFKKASGLEATKEKADERSSRFDKAVAGSVQTMRQLRRLQEHARDAFTLVMVDETHRILAKSYQDILAYFNKARVLGVTATADRGDKKELGTYFERIAIDYGLRDACKDAWLVRPVVQTCPLKIDLNAVKTRGSDFDAGEIAHAIEPFLMQIAEEVRSKASHLKTVIFMPSIDTAQKLTLALLTVGLKASYVSGYCTDRKEKLAAYERAGAGSVICNAMLLTEGWDVPEVSCVICLRPTKIRALYTQMVGRGTRPHPSVVPQLNAAADREARAIIIRKSIKPRLIILDFLWLYEKHDLIRPASLVSKNPEQAQRMRELGDGDLLEQQDRTEHDWLAKLEKELKKNQNKKAKLIDPLTAAVELGDSDLADYEPETLRDAMPPTETHISVLTQQGVDPATIRSRGQAEQIIERIMRREQQGLSSLRQLHFLSQLGVDATLYSKEEAQAAIGRKIGNWHQRA